METKRIEVNVGVLHELNIHPTAYLILSLIVNSERKYTTLHKGSRVHYSELKANEIAKQLFINPSSVSARIKELKHKYCIDKTNFGFCVYPYVDNLFSKKTDFTLDLKLFSFCKTTEQALITCVLWKESQFNSKLNKSLLGDKLRLSRRTVANTISVLEDANILRICKGLVVFTDKGKAVFEN